MLYRLLADAVLLIHLGFILFVALGGFAVLRWRRLVWLHVPTVLWGIWVEFAGWICPLTPLENTLRQMGGEASYTGDFIGHYLALVIYPESLTREAQVTFGALALLGNILIYRHFLYRTNQHKTSQKNI